jgi:glutathione S-transferase
MDRLSLQNPVFVTYVIAATIMILKVVSMSWLTVVRMTQAKGGFRSPEDIRKTPLNPDPNPKQLEPNERVERIRRIMLNDLENVPFFLFAGLLFVLTGPSLTLTAFSTDTWCRGFCTLLLILPRAPTTRVPSSGPSDP